MAAHLLPTASELIERWYRAGLAAVEPEAAVRRHLRLEGRDLIVGDRRLTIGGRLIVVGAGKAAVAMARGAEAVCGDLIADGLVITKDGHATEPLPERVRVAEAAHPVPDERGVRATREILELLDASRPDDIALALISGGGSALLEVPRPPATLHDLAVTTDLLLRAGAPIQDLNAVRVPLSLVKGGGLRKEGRLTAFVTLILSDVLGNDPRVIASGPTVADYAGVTKARAALAVLDRYDVREIVPPAVVSVLETGSRTLQCDMPSGLGDVLEIVGDNAAAVEAVRIAAENDGFDARIVWREKQGEAADLGRAWVDACAEAGDDVDVLLGGGEATVTVRGDGLGGRNTEFALAAALAMADRREDDWVVASLATDGQDALTGVAGAIADGATADWARAAGIDPVAALARNDSLRVFVAAGGVVRPGPTGTNVNDVYLAIRLSALSRDRRTEPPGR